MENTEEKIKSLKDIVTEGYNWQTGLSTIIVDLCKRVKDLEETTKQINKQLK